MSDTGFSEAAGGSPEFDPAGGLSAGAMIRRAREAAGLHVAALAVSMKIPVKKLEALEADKLDLLHDAVFVRALAASVCRALKVDPAPVLGKLPLNTAPTLSGSDRGINTPFRTPGGAARASVPSLLFKPAALLVIALLLAGGVIYFLPSIKLPQWNSEAPEQAAKPAEETGAPSQQPVSAGGFEQGASNSDGAVTNVPNLTANAGMAANTDAVVASAPAAPASRPAVQAVKSPPAVPSLAAAGQSASPAGPASRVQLAASRPQAVASQSAAAASKPAVAASRPVAAASKPAATLPTTGMVVFKAKGQTWVKVVDAKGIVQLSKMLVGGDVVGVSGTAPLAVVVGRVDVTEVEVRGQALSLAATAKDNVARFEVK